MLTVDYDLVRRFGYRKINKISTTIRKFDISQTGESYFKQNPNAQFYIFEESMGIELIGFTDKTKQSMARTIALNYVIEDDGSKFPTHLICVTKQQRWWYGKYDFLVYSLRDDQIHEIEKEYSVIIN